jgi:hypothetical protein
VVREDGQPDRRRTADAGFLSGDQLQRIDGLADPLGDHDHGVDSAFRQDNHELVAAVAGEDVAVAQGALHLAGKALQVVRRRCGRSCR